MEFYIFLIGILFLLAISDLIVGVSNDAVNFLVSAIGSKSAPFWVIMTVASIGILFGATFSSGMMEVARKGIFRPEMFVFSDIIIIFLAVMITDIILLDIFNTFGLPTSTTVSIVFELLGAAVAISLIKLTNSGESFSELGNYINTEKALAIIFGILLSVVVAFSVGLIVQAITRLFFSFNYEKTYDYFGAIWGGIAITAITYFILIKGVKGASFMSLDAKMWIKENSYKIILISLIFWTIALKLLDFIKKFNILRFIVIVGTFALAMAFAGNDLVNFIGVPLAGLKSFELFNASGQLDTAFSMASLSKKVETPPLYLLIAGLIMVVTLIFSKKARGVTKTQLDLARQDEGQERFGSSLLSRSLVRSAIFFFGTVKVIIPDKIFSKIESRFSQVGVSKSEEQTFDLVRASVNLTVASILIAFATSLKLPLSTTYVTFMVAMGTSLADGAWGRESAVYRITGVISIIGGWFLTAITAFTVAFIFANIINAGGNIAIIALLAFAVFIIIKTKKIHKKRQENEQEKVLENGKEISEETPILEKCSISVEKTLKNLIKIYSNILESLKNEDRKELKKIQKEVDKLNSKSKNLKDNVHNTIKLLENESIETGHYYVQVLDFLREIAHCINFISLPVLKHIENKHKGFLKEQIDELYEIDESLKNLVNSILNIINNESFENLEEVLSIQENILLKIKNFRKTQLKRIKNGELSTRNSILYLNFLTETKNLILNAVNLLKSQRDFILEQK